MRNSERRKCFEVLTVLRNVPDPDDDPDDEDEPPRLLIEPFETLPTPRELPDYYELIRCPVDCRAASACPRPHGRAPYASPVAPRRRVELMLTNAQTYNDEESQIFQEAGFLRFAFRGMSARARGSPCRGASRCTSRATSLSFNGRSGGRALVSGGGSGADERDPFEADTRRAR